MHLNNQIRGHLAAIGTVSVWGATFVSTKLLLVQFSPVEILMLRIALGFLALILVHPGRMPLKERWHELYFAAAGLTGLVLHYLLNTIALGDADASIVGVIVSSAPLFTGIFGTIFLKERLSRGFFIGFVLAITGIGLIALPDDGAHIGLWGVLLSLVSAVSWGVYSTLTRKIADKGYPTLGATRRVFFYGLLFMLPIAAASGFRMQAVRAADFTAIANLLFLGLIASAACFVSWGFAVRMLGAVKACNYIYASPVVTVILAALILGERMGARSILGAALVLVGLVLSEGRIRPRNEADDGAV